MLWSEQASLRCDVPWTVVSRMRKPCDQCSKQKEEEVESSGVRTHLAWFNQNEIAARPAWRGRGQDSRR